jgi:predicted Fe-Mo cluster-binding NifX family protein
MFPVCHDEPSRGIKMKLCVPIEEDKGLDSQVCGHFGSAPAFILYDIEKGEHSLIDNSKQERVHGSCTPLQALEGQGVEALVVGGIGARAIMILNASGIRVFQAQAGTVRETVTAFRDGNLREISAAEGCQGHGSNGCH